MSAPDHLEVDHRDTNSLNNQRFNLRLCTRAENSRNRRPQQRCSSMYKGVYWRKISKKWQSQITFEGQYYNLGSLKDERQAALFYDIAAVHFFGEFARLNFPEHIEFIKNYWKEKELYGAF